MTLIRMLVVSAVWFGTIGLILLAAVTADEDAQEAAKHFVEEWRDPTSTFLASDQLAWQQKIHAYHEYMSR